MWSVRLLNKSALSLSAFKKREEKTSLEKWSKHRDIGNSEGKKTLMFEMLISTLSNQENEN